MKYFSHRKEFVFDVRVFTKSEVLEGFSKKKKIAILLVGEDMDADKVSELAGQVMILCSGRLVQEHERYAMVYKYQSAEEIMRDVLSCYMEERENERYTYISNKRECKFIGVFSPCGGKGTTTFSFGMGQILAEKQKVLYINMELFPGNYQELSNESNSGFSELIYYIKQKKSNFYIKLSTLIHHFHNMDYIMPPGHYNDLCQVQEEDVIVLLKELRENSDYEMIIFDIGFINEGIVTLLENCSQIYMPKSQYGIEKGKDERFFEFLREEEKEDIINKIETIEIPFDKNLDKGIDVLEQSCTGTIGAFIHNLL